MTQDELKCTRSLNIDNKGCSKKCEGLNIVSYNLQILETELTKSKKTRFFSKLADQYNKYKGKYEFPSKFKSTYL